MLLHDRGHSGRVLHTPAGDAPADAVFAGLIDRLEKNGTLGREEFLYLLRNCRGANLRLLFDRAATVRRKVYGHTIFLRGLIEFTNHCRNNCLYCGIRAGNTRAERYRLSADEILACCRQGYELGFRTFVLQGGEDPGFADEALAAVVRAVKAAYPDTAVTLSVGERSREVYQFFRQAGADRYLLRHETATAAHYRQLHPAGMDWENRMRCLQDLRELGFQTGCGFMVGSPFQRDEELAEELLFLSRFRPEMAGIGPFIPHYQTPFGSYPAGSAEVTLALLAMIRIMLKTVLLPATTALGTLLPDGRERGILAGANVIMPNLSPESVREKYLLYNNKLHTGCEAAEAVEQLKQSLRQIGCEAVIDRGDCRKDFCDV
ncbi:MAG: [Lentisphaeria bacterium]|nr:[FeFe] hydrogenase H-cluster radical SAM maturase HydE [Lentisphaeria bacterium]